MEIIGGVTAVPFGLLACRIDGREVQITELGENGFAFRTAEPIAMRKNEDHRIEVSFYHMVQDQRYPKISGHHTGTGRKMVPRIFGRCAAGGLPERGAGTGAVV